MAQQEKNIFSAAKIGNLKLRNRTIKAGCFEGMYQNQKPTERLIEHHRAIAKGGVGMTTLAYASVSKSGMVSGQELLIEKELIPDLKKIADAVHQENSALSIQLGHAGYFTHKKVIHTKPLSPSNNICFMRNSTARAMTELDISIIRDDFKNACVIAKESGIDAVEIQAGHGYLLSQFLSPKLNRRKDAYGGSVENRLKFPVSVIQAIREGVGPEFPILIKMNYEDGFRGGMTIEDSVVAAKGFEAAGASAIIGSCGFISKSPFYIMRGDIPIKKFLQSAPNKLTKYGMKLYYHLGMKKNNHFSEMFLKEYGKKMIPKIDIPVVLLGGVLSLDNMNEAINDGFEFVQIGRSLIREPELINKYQNGDCITSECKHCNKCMTEMYKGLKCVDLAETLQNR